MTNRIMPVKRLTEIAGAKIPFFMIFWARPDQKRAIHWTLSPLVKRTRATGNHDLGLLCKCEQEGECLCYFEIIRRDKIEQFWCTEDDFQYLGDFLRDD